MIVVDKKVNCRDVGEANRMNELQVSRSAKPQLQGADDCLVVAVKQLAYRARGRESDFPTEPTVEEEEEEATIDATSAYCRIKCNASSHVQVLSAVRLSWVEVN
jgi:hypothetical protein